MKLGRRVSKPLALFVTIVLVLSTTSEIALSQQLDCEGTRQAWLSDRSMSDFMAKHHCSCSNGPNRMPVCVSRSGGGGGSYTQAPAKKKYSGTKAMHHAAMQGFAAGLVAGLMSNLLTAPPAASKAPAIQTYEPTPEQRQKWAEQAQRLKEQMEAVDKAYKEERSRLGSQALAQLKGSLKGRSDSLPPEVQRERAANAIDQLSCSAWFGLEAAEYALKRDGNSAKHYGDMSALAGSGDMTECPKPPSKDIPEVPGPLSEIPQLQLYELINEEAKDAAAEAEALHIKKEQAEQKITELQVKIKDLRTQLPHPAAIGEKESATEDPLIAEAEKALAEALKEKSEADLGLIQKEKEIEAYKQMYARYEAPTK